MAKLSALKQSKEKQNEGVWVNFEGVQFKLARLGNDNYKAMIAAESAANRERKERGEPVRDADQFWVELLASTVLVGWRDLEDDNGSPLPYSADEAAKILQDERFADVREFVEREAASRRNYRDAADASAEKN